MSYPGGERNRQLKGTGDSSQHQRGSADAHSQCPSGLGADATNYHSDMLCRDAWSRSSCDLAGRERAAIGGCVWTGEQCRSQCTGEGVSSGSAYEEKSVVVCPDKPGRQYDIRAIPLPATSVKHYGLEIRETLMPADVGWSVGSADDYKFRVSPNHYNTNGGEYGFLYHENGARTPVRFWYAACKPECKNVISLVTGDFNVDKANTIHGDPHYKYWRETCDGKDKLWRQSWPIDHRGNASLENEFVCYLDNKCIDLYMPSGTKRMYDCNSRVIV